MPTWQQFCNDGVNDFCCELRLVNSCFFFVQPQENYNATQLTLLFGFVIFAGYDARPSNRSSKYVPLYHYNCGFCWDYINCYK